MKEKSLDQWSAWDGRNISSKINRHEKSQTHIKAAAVYGRWKSGKTIDELSEKITRHNINFWRKVLHRLVSILLTMCSLNIREHPRQ